MTMVITLITWYTTCSYFSRFKNYYIFFKCDMSQMHKSCPLGTLGDKQALGINEVELLLPSWCYWCEGLYFNPNPIHCFLTIPESF